MSALPRISIPKFEITLPSTGEKILMRSFIAKEEKALLMAQETEDPGNIMTAIQDVVDACILTEPKPRLAVFDVDYLLLKLRSLSVSNVVEFSIKDPETEEKIDIALDINNTEIVRPDGHNRHIKCDDETTIVMRYPAVHVMADLLMNNEPDKKAAISFDNIMDCIECVVVGDQIVKMDDIDLATKVEWVDNLPKPALDDMRKFFETMPYVKHVITYTRKDGAERTVEIKGLKLFFE